MKGRLVDEEVQLVRGGEPQDDTRGPVIIVVEDGLVISGPKKHVKRLLRSSGLRELVRKVPRDRISQLLRKGGQFAEVASTIAAESIYWLNLIPEDAQRAAHEGLIKTATPGVSYAMIGDFGSSKPWLRVQDGSLSKVGNPAFLSGMGGFLQQLGNEQQAQAFLAYLKRIDAKVDDVRRGQIGAEVAPLKSAARKIKDLMMLRRTDPIASKWHAPAHIETMITTALYWALDRLTDVADKASSDNFVEIYRSRKVTETDASYLLSIIARCFKLLADLDDLHLEVVMESMPDQLERQRRGLKEVRQDLLDEVAPHIDQALTKLHAAGAKADLHAAVLNPWSQEVIGSVNRIGRDVDELRAPLGLDTAWEDVVPSDRLSALKSRDHHKTTALDAVVVAGIGATTALTSLVTMRLVSGKGSD